MDDRIKKNIIKKISRRDKISPNTCVTEFSAIFCREEPVINRAIGIVIISPKNIIKKVQMIQRTFLYKLSL